MKSIRQLLEQEARYPTPEYLQWFVADELGLAFYYSDVEGKLPKKYCSGFCVNHITCSSKGFSYAAKCIDKSRIIRFNWGLKHPKF